MNNQYGEYQPIHEIHKVKEILNYISFDTLICWDLDNTLLQAKHELGSDQWFTCMMELVGRQLEKHPDAKAWAIEIYTQVQHLTQAHVVEENVVKYIKFFKDIGLPQLIITARGHDLKATSLRQLHENHLFFNEDQIIFCEGQSKAKALGQILPKLPSVKHFIMVDDKASHVHDIQALARMLATRFNGFSYRHLDARVKQFDMKLASTQLKVLLEELPQQAREYILHLGLLQLAGKPNELSSFSYFSSGRHITYQAKDEACLDSNATVSPV